MKIPALPTHIVTTSRQDPASNQIVNPLADVPASISLLPVPRTMQQGEQSLYLMTLAPGSTIQVDDKVLATPVETRTLAPTGALAVTFTVQDVEQRAGLIPRTRARMVKITQ